MAKRNWRTVIWMVEVRHLDSDRAWAVTGPKWFHTRRECKSYIANEIAKSNFTVYEYRAKRYEPALSAQEGE